MSESDQPSATGSFSRFWLLLLTLIGGVFLTQQSPPGELKTAVAKADLDAEKKGIAHPVDRSQRQKMHEPLREFLGIPETLATAPARTAAPMATPAPTTNPEPLANPLNADKPEPSIEDAASAATNSVAVDQAGNSGPFKIEPAIAEEIRKQIGRLEFLIVSVADPIETKLSYRFDLQLDVLQKALAAEGYLFDRYELPWHDKHDLKRFHSEPGVLLFRKQGPSVVKGKEDRTDLLLVYLIGEIPTGGMHELAFVEAVHQIVGLHRFNSPFTMVSKNAHPPTIMVSGPAFSGGADSLARGVRKCLLNKETAACHFEIINGSAMAVDFERFQKLAGVDLNAKGRVQVHSTIHDASLLRDVLIEHIQRRSLVQSEKIVWLSESGTAYGASPSPKNILEFRFPAWISRVRAVREQHRQSEPKNNLSPTNYRVPIPYEDSQTARDFPHMMTPSMTAPSAELVLGQILSTIRNEGVEYVGISASDIRDPVFLAEMIREQSPDVQILLVTADVLYLHPQYRSKLHGALVASSYSLFPEDQDWCFPYFGKHKRVFSNQSLYGFYNSIVLLRGLSDKAYIRRSKENPAELTADADRAANHLPIAYGKPMAPYFAKTAFEPPIWISMIGPTGILPIDCYGPSDVGKMQDATKKNNGVEPSSSARRSEKLLIKLRCPHPIRDPSSVKSKTHIDKLPTKGSYDPRIAPSTWIVFWFWNTLGVLLLLAAHGLCVGKWSKPLNLGQKPFRLRKSRLYEVRQGFRGLIAAAIAAPVTCFAVLIAIPFLVQGADWEGWDKVWMAAAAVIAMLNSAGLIGLVLVDVFAVVTVVKPAMRPRGSQRLLPLTVAAGGTASLFGGVITCQVFDRYPLAMVLSYCVWTDTWNGVSMMLPVQLTSGAIVVLAYSFLQQCYSLGGVQAIPRPVWPLIPQARFADRALTRKTLLLPLVHSLSREQPLFSLAHFKLILKSNWLCLGFPFFGIIWLGWLATQTANTQLLATRIDYSCLGFIFACSLWCVEFSRTMEVCRQLSADLNDFTHQFPEPLTKWKAVFKRLAPPEQGGLTSLWGRHSGMRLERLNRVVQRLANAQAGHQAGAINAAAEELYALQIEAYARQVFRHGFQSFVGLMLSDCLLLLTAVSFPFNSEPLLELTTATMLFAASLVMCWFYVKFDRQSLVSLMVGGQPGHIDWNMDMLQTVVPPLALGLVAILGQVFPEIWNWLGSLLDPLSRSTG